MLPSSAKLDTARKALRDQAALSKGPTILSVLNSLKAEILLCVDAGHGGYVIYQHLVRSGWTVSQPAFFKAWRTFRKDNHIDGRDQTARIVPEPVSTSPRLAQANVRPAVITPTTPPTRGSALEKLSTPSVSQLLRESGI